MEFHEVVRRRRMVRRYRDESVAPGAVDRILDASRRGPSAGFAQGVEFVVVTSAEGRRALATAAGEASYVERGMVPWLSAAPVHVVIAVDVERYRARYAESDKRGGGEWNAPYWWVDAGAALMLMLLAAVDEGLAAGFLGSHAIDGLGAIVGLPDWFEILGVVTIGHAAEDPVVGSATRGRRNRSSVVHTESWTRDLKID